MQESLNLYPFFEPLANVTNIYFALFAQMISVMPPFILVLYRSWLVFKYLSDNFFLKFSTHKAFGEQSELNDLIEKRRLMIIHNRTFEFCNDPYKEEIFQNIYHQFGGEFTKTELRKVAKLFVIRDFSLKYKGDKSPWWSTVIYGLLIGFLLILILLCFLIAISGFKENALYAFYTLLWGALFSVILYMILMFRTVKDVAEDLDNKLKKVAITSTTDSSVLSDSQG